MKEKPVTEVAKNIGELGAVFTTRVTSNNDTSYHYHHFYEVFVVTEGEIDHYINGEKVEEIYRVPGPDIYPGNPLKKQVGIMPTPTPIPSPSPTPSPATAP